MSKEWKAPQGFEAGTAPEIPLTAVNSSQVAAIGYDASTKTLACTFTAGGPIYHYPNVEPETHAQFIAAESIGKFFGAHIKALPFKKYRAPEVPSRLPSAA